LGSIDKLIAYKDRLYVLDKNIAKSLLAFNREGTFIEKIGTMGQGPNEYIKIKDFTVNTNKNEIILLDANKMIFYDLDGKYLKSVQLHDEDCVITTLQYFNDLIYTDIHAFQKKEDDCLLQVVDIDNGMRKTRFLKTNEQNKGWNETFVANMNYFIPKLDPPFLFRHSFMDTIFSITNKGLSPYLVVKSKDMITEKDLVLPSNTDPFDFLRSLSEKDKIYNIFSYFETNNYISFQYFKGTNLKYVIYNKKDRTTRIAEDLYNDLVFTGKQPYTTRFIFFDKNGVYEYINSNKSPYLLSFIRDKKLKERFNDQLKDFNEDSNPVIFYYEFK